MTSASDDYYKRAMVAISVLGILGIGILYVLSGGISQGASGTAALTHASAGRTAPATAPSLNLRTLDGNPLSLEDFQKDKRPALLYFGATWCPHCTADLSRVAAVHPKYKDAVRFVWVDIDQTEPASLIRQFKEKFNADSIEFAQADQRTLVNYGIQYTTTRFAVQPSGAVTPAGTGELSQAQWEALFKQLSGL